MVNNPIKGAIAWVLFLTVCVGGCATDTGGKDFNEGNVSKIVIGKTTKSEVSNYLGTPLSTERAMDDVKWVYNYSIHKRSMPFAPGGSIKEDMESKGVKITFGKNGVVKDCMYITISSRDGTVYTLGEDKDTSVIRCQDTR